MPPDPRVSGETYASKATGISFNRIDNLEYE